MIQRLIAQERVTIEIRGPDGKIKEQNIWVAEPGPEKESNPFLLDERPSGETIHKGDTHDRG